MLHIQKKQAPFKYCLDTYVIRDPDCFGFCCTNGDNLLPKIKIAKIAGYEGVEIWHKDVSKYCDEVGTLSSLRKEIEALGLKIPSYKFADRWDDLDILKTAAALGAESCVFKVVRDQYKGPAPPMQKMIAEYEKLLEEGNDLNIRPSLEFMSLAKCYNSIDSVCDILEGVDHPLASLVLDTWHLWRNDNKNFNSCPFHRIRPEWVSVVHFTDARKDLPRQEQRDGARKIPGEGLLNLSKFCNKLMERKFDGWLSLNVYDQTLWHEDPLKVASRGLYAMRKAAERDTFGKLRDSYNWRGEQEYRCSGLWSRSYWNHLDPRVKRTNRREKLLEILQDKLKGKVLDFKCGFSPLSEYVTHGVDAFPGCVDYLKEKHPNAQWFCESDEEFARHFKEKIDVLMHIGLGDSMTETESHLKLRKNCQPDLVILEAAADEDGEDTKDDNRANWELLKDGLHGETYVIDTDMPHRPKRIMFVGVPNDKKQDSSSDRGRL